MILKYKKSFESRMAGAQALAEKGATEGERSAARAAIERMKASQPKPPMPKAPHSSFPAYHKIAESHNYSMVHPEHGSTDVTYTRGTHTLNLTNNGNWNHSAGRYGISPDSLSRHLNSIHPDTAPKAPTGGLSGRAARNMGKSQGIRKSMESRMAGAKALAERGATEGERAAAREAIKRMSSATNDAKTHRAHNAEAFHHVLTRHGYTSNEDPMDSSRERDNRMYNHNKDPNNEHTVGVWGNGKWFHASEAHTKKTGQAFTGKGHGAQSLNEHLNSQEHAGRWKGLNPDQRDARLNAFERDAMPNTRRIDKGEGAEGSFSSWGLQSAGGSIPGKRGKKKPPNLAADGSAPSDGGTTLISEYKKNKPPLKDVYQEKDKHNVEEDDMERSMGVLEYMELCKSKRGKLGSGARFKALAKDAAASGADNPNAVAAAAGIKKYGKKKMEKMAAAGKKHKKKIEKALPKWKKKTLEQWKNQGKRIGHKVVSGAGKLGKKAEAGSKKFK